MLKTIEISTSELYVGLYVCGLDRSWLGTPFITQGFYIRDADDIDELRKYCEHVQVDVQKSRSLPRATIERASNGPARSPTGRKLDDRPRVPLDRIFKDRAFTTYEDRHTWVEEQPHAKIALDTLLLDINDIFADVIEGGNINVIKMKKCVVPVVDSITRNPDACQWVARLKQHDEYTYQHSLGAAIWAVSLGRQIGLARHDLRSLAMGCMLMDVGKLRVDPGLLKAKRALNLEETAEMANHVDHGLEILQESGLVNKDVLDMVAHHHERHDGSGYPNGLREDQIPAFARIAGIVDTYDALTSNREYAPALSPSEAIRVLYSARDRDFQAELVEAFIQAIGLYPAGTLVELSSGEVAVVVAEYRARRLRPKVMVLLDANKQKLAKARMVDLLDNLDNGQTRSLSIARGLDPGAYGIDLTSIKFQAD